MREFQQLSMTILRFLSFSFSSPSGSYDSSATFSS
ncbi:hypothetical protein CIPAW_03G235400 [Carya illinoinensis]|uniref:Uncharacterized protein n=1 Tax=Carya illinoinensis TaxID=32201 RepID=A0A8T1R7J3_CARIL|nr:hypothetical protein CIPAW_03G235400 [Carya illinoinensis]